MSGAGTMYRALADVATAKLERHSEARTSRATQCPVCRCAGAHARGHDAQREAISTRALLCGRGGRPRHALTGFHRGNGRGRPVTGMVVMGFKFESAGREE